MFAVRGWKVPENALKTQTTESITTQGGPASSERTEETDGAIKSRKRKRAGRVHTEHVHNDSRDISSLWQTYVERQHRDSASKSTANKLGPKHTADYHLLNTQLGETDAQSLQAASKERSKKSKKSKKERRARKRDAAHESESSEKHDTRKLSTEGQVHGPAPGNATGSQMAEPKLTKLQSNMRQKLISSRFRHLNETLYTKPSSASMDLFKQNPEFFQEYHEGFRRQVETWPQNPLDNFIAWIRRRGAAGDPKRDLKPHRRAFKGKNDHLDQGKVAASDPLPRNPRTGICTIVDLGCGEGRLASALLNSPPIPPLTKRLKVAIKSFDLASTSQHVTACDIKELPLVDDSVDIAIFCLALMGTNWIDFIEEAHRVLRWKGECWISEVGSRFVGPNKQAPVEHSVGNRRHGKVQGSEKATGGVNSRPLTVDEINPPPEPITDVSTFVDVLRRRGLQLMEEPVMAEKGYFVTMRFSKCLPPSKGKGVLFNKPAGKLAFIDDTEGVMSDVAEASVLKPCIYKPR